MQTAISTIHTTLITTMALARYHDSLAEYPSVGIIIAYESLKENVATHILEKRNNPIISPSAQTDGP